MSKILIAISLLVAAAVNAPAALLVQYDFTNGSDSPSTTGSNVVTYDMTSTDSDFGFSSSGDNLFVRADNTTSSASDAATDGKRFELRLDAATGYQLNLTELKFDTYWQQQSNMIGTAEPQWIIDSNLGGFDPENPDVGTHSIVSANSNSPDAASFTLGAQFQGLSAVTFRIYAIDQVSGTNAGIFRADDLTIEGVSAVPEPTSASILILGVFALAMLHRSRRVANA